MTLVLLIISAAIAAWSKGLAADLWQHRRCAARNLAWTIEIMFTGIAIGAGIQLLFRG